MRTVEWNYDTDKFQMIDQRLLPGEFKIAVFEDYRDVAQAITDMVVRGAPAIGGAAAFGLALAAKESNAQDYATMHADLENAARHLKGARPTAVNLAWALDRILDRISTIKSNPDEIRRAVQMRDAYLRDKLARE